jgi:hypothetical protein
MVGCYPRSVAPPPRERYDFDDYRRRPHKRKKGWIEELFD